MRLTAATIVMTTVMFLFPPHCSAQIPVSSCRDKQTGKWQLWVMDFEVRSDQGSVFLKQYAAEFVQRYKGRHAVEDDYSATNADPPETHRVGGTRCVNPKACVLIWLIVNPSSGGFRSGQMSGVCNPGNKNLIFPEPPPLYDCEPSYSDTACHSFIALRLANTMHDIEKPTKARK
jgi:hypothetical protein